MIEWLAVLAIGWFVFGSLSFWILVVLGLIVLFYFVDVHKPGKALTATIVASILISYSNGWYPLDYVWNHPLQLLAYSIGYVIVGIGWAFFKFDRHLSKLLETTFQRLVVKETLHPNLYKDRITTWLMWWPLSIAHDVVTDLFDLVYSMISSQLERISKKYEARLPPPK